MNKYILILFIPILFSCEKYFHEEDNEYLVLDTYQKKIDMINGIYAQLVIIHSQDYFELLCRSDDVNKYDNFRFDYCRNWGSTDYNSLIENLYKNLYAAIVNANSLIKQLGENENPELVGEVYFLRAYCYFKLARFFGTPPLVTDIEVNYQIPKPGYREVYEFIEADLLKAIEFLPLTYSNCRILGETPHKGSAKALLAEVYLSMAGYPVNDSTKYISAARLSGEIIANAEYYGISLLNDFADLWKEENRHNSENIFGLFFNINKERPIAMFFDINIHTLHNTLGTNRLIAPELKYFNTYPHNYRKIVSMITGRYEYIELPVLDTIYNIFFLNKIDPLKNPCSLIHNFYIFKWIDYDSFINQLHYEQTKEVYKTIYLLRYAQTLLTYAEAKGHLGELDESAYKAVNIIRRRSYNLDINSPSPYDLQSNLTKEQFTDSVVWERAWELFYEPDGRWFDIIRLNLKDKLSEYRYDFDFPTVIDDSYLTSDWYFYLIPQEDRWLNPNLEIEE